MAEETTEKTHTCPGCGSESTESPGTCCGAERREKCSKCGHTHKEKGGCGGCA